MFKALSINRTAFNYLLFLIAATFAVYFNMLGAGMINWDDAEFTIDNRDIQSFDIKAFFSNFYLGNYPPITMVSFAIDYAIGKTNPSVYHFTNILLHAFNTCLVFVFFNRLQNNKNIAFFTALIFAIHPMQTESVSWISERKNVLCAFFYFLSLIAYINYLTHTSRRSYFFVLIAAILALFSKGMAVSLPISLLAIDIWTKRPLTKKIIIEKIPFFILSLVFGYLAVKAQATSGFLKTDLSYGFIQKILFSGEAFILYLLKLVIPIKLSALYPYPTEFNLLQIIGLFALGSAIIGLFVFTKRKNHLLAGAILFFLGNIIFVLQFVAFGAVLMADHYVYIACLGVIYPLLVFLFTFLKQQRAAIVASSIICVFLGAYTVSRNLVWKNNLNFWSDIVKKYPSSHVALNSLGAEYMLMGKHKEALGYINKAIYLSPTFYKAHYNSGLVYAREGNYAEALKSFNAAIRLNNYTKAIVARGNIYFELKEYPKAMTDANYVISREPRNAKAYFLLGNCFHDINDLEKAIYNYDKAIALKNNDPSIFLSRGIAYGKAQQFDKCLKDLDEATRISPNFAEAYYWKGVAKVNLNQNPCADLKKAVSLGFSQAHGPLSKYCR